MPEETVVGMVGKDNDGILREEEIESKTKADQMQPLSEKR